MATRISSTPLIGADLDNTGISSLINRTNGTPGQARVLTQVLGADGKLYVYGEANAAIPASTAVCTLAAATGLVTATGGAYTSPATALIVGDRAWFSKANA